MATSRATAGLSEMVAMGRVPAHHAEPLRNYVGDGGDRSVAEWDDLYGEFMSKPTGVSRKEWHEKFTRKER